MTAERAEEMLRLYKSYSGRCAYLKEVLEVLRNEERLSTAELENTLLAGKGVASDGMPHGTTVGNPTERAAMMLISGFVSVDIAELQKRISEYEAEYRQKQLVVVFVDSWLAGLTVKERWMIERSYFDGLTYREINAMYREQFGGECSKDSLRRIKKEALEKIFDMSK